MSLTGNFFKRRLIFLLLFLFLFSLVLSTFLILRHLLKPEVQKAFLENALQEATGLTVSIDKAQVSFWPEIGISCQGVKVSDLASMDSLLLRFQLLPIFSRKIVIDGAIMEGFNIFIIRDEKGSFNLPSLPQGPPKPITPWEFSLEKLLIRRGRATLVDHYGFEKPHTLEFHDLFFSLLEKHGQLSLAMNAQIPQEPQEKATIDLSLITSEAAMKAQEPLSGLSSAKGSIEGLDLFPFSPYISRHVPLQELKGQGSMEFTYTPDLWKATLQLKALSFLPQEGQNLLPVEAERVSLNLSFFPRDSLLDIEHAHIVHKGSDIEGGIKVDGRNLLNPLIDAQVFAHTFSWQDIERPLSLWAPSLHQRLKELNPRGAIKGLQIAYKGPFDQIDETLSLQRPPGTTLMAMAELDNFSLNWKPLRYPLQSWKGKIGLQDQAVVLDGLEGRWGESRIQAMRGRVEEPLIKPLFDMHFKADIDLRQLHSYLQGSPFLSSKKGAWVKQFKAFKGKAQAEMSLQGPLEKAPWIAQGQVALKGCSFSHFSSPLPFSEIKGNIHVQGEDLKIDNLKGQWGASPFSLKGSLQHLSSPEPSFQLQGTSALDGEHIKKLCPSLEGKGLVFLSRGPASLSLEVKGTLRKFQVLSTSDLSPLSFQYSPWFRKPEGHSLKVSLKGELLDGKELRVEELTVGLGSAILHASGSMRSLRETPERLELTISEMDLAQLKPFLMEDHYEARGTVKASINFLKHPAHPLTTSLWGHISLKEVSLSLPALTMPLERVNAEVNFDDKTIRLKKGQLKFGKTDIDSLEAKVKGMKRPQVYLKAHATRTDLLEIRHLFKKKEKAKPSFWAREPFASATIKGLLEADEAIYQEYLMEGLKTQAFFQNGVFTMHPFKARALGGEVTFDPEVRFSTDGEPMFIVRPRFIGLRVEEYYKAEGWFPPPFTGECNLWGTLRGPGSKFGKGWRHLEGDIQVHFRKGNIRKYNLLTKVISLLNLPKTFKFKVPEFSPNKGMPYKSITASFAMKDGKGFTKDFFIDSDVMNIAVTGEVNLLEDTLDLELGAKPLGTLESLMSKIPLVGKRVTEETEGLFTTYFIVRGPKLDPEVRPVLFETLMNGAKDVLGKLLGLPQKVVSPIISPGSS